MIQELQAAVLIFSWGGIYMTNPTKAVVRIQ